MLFRSQSDEGSFEEEEMSEGEEEEYNRRAIEEDMLRRLGDEIHGRAALRVVGGDGLPTRVIAGDRELSREESEIILREMDTDIPEMYDEEGASVSFDFPITERTVRGDKKQKVGEGGEREEKERLARMAVAVNKMRDMNLGKK